MACTGTPDATAWTAATAAGTSSHTSVLLRITTGRGAAVPGGDEIALDAAQAEIAVEAHHDEHRVDVGGHHLLHRRVAGHLARELAPPRQDRLDDGAVASSGRRQGHPVAHRRELVAARGAVAQAARRLGVALALVRVDAVDVVVLDGHARRHQAVRGVGPKGVLPRLIPAELLEGEGHGAQDNRARVLKVLKVLKVLRVRKVHKGAEGSSPLTVMALAKRFAQEGAGAGDE